MRKQFTNAIGKKVFTLLTAAVIIFSSAASAYALPDRATKTTNQAEVSYQGKKDNYLVFKVDYKNEPAQPFELIIRNDQHEVLYSKKFDSRPLSTDIYFTELPENCKLIFSILTGKKEDSQAFQINTNFKTVQELVVKGI